MGWGGKGARNLLGFPLLQAYLSLERVEYVTTGLAFSELLRSQSSAPNPWVLHGSPQRSGGQWQKQGWAMGVADGQSEFSRRWWDLWSADARRQNMHKPHRCFINQQAHCPHFPRILEIAYIQNSLSVSVYILSLSPTHMITYFATLNVYPCMLFTTVFPGAPSNIANLVWPWSEAILLNPSTLLNSSAWRNIWTSGINKAVILQIWRIREDSTFFQWKGRLK